MWISVCCCKAEWSSTSSILEVTFFMSFRVYLAFFLKRGFFFGSSFFLVSSSCICSSIFCIWYSLKLWVLVSPKSILSIYFCSSSSKSAFITAFLTFSSLFFFFIFSFFSLSVSFGGESSCIFFLNCFSARRMLSDSKASSEDLKCSTLGAGFSLAISSTSLASSLGTPDSFFSSSLEASSNGSPRSSSFAFLALIFSSSIFFCFSFSALIFSCLIFS